MADVGPKIMELTKTVLLILIAASMSSCATHSVKHVSPSEIPCTIEVIDANIQTVFEILSWNCHLRAVHKAGSCRGAHAHEPVFSFGGYHTNSQSNTLASDTDPFALSNTNSIGPITLSVSNMPISEILSTACEQAKCDFRISGRSVLVAKQLYTPSVHTTDAGASLRAHLDKAIIPELEFRFASLHDVAAVLQECVTEFGPRDAGLTVPIRYVDKSTILITFNGRYLSVTEILTHLTETAPISCVIDKAGVTIRRRP
jgi:hypothetical protein